MNNKRVSALGIVILMVAATVWAAPVPASAYTISEFSSGLMASSGPVEIVTGSDGNLWFTDYGASAIGKITPSGVITEFSSGLPASSGPVEITTGQDGNLWFTDYGANAIGKITLSGAITEFSSALSASSGPWGITTGTDENIWFTECLGNAIGKITPSGVITEITSGIPADSAPWGITAGPDGNLWFTEYLGNVIGRLTNSTPAPSTPIATPAPTPTTAPTPTPTTAPTPSPTPTTAPMPTPTPTATPTPTPVTTPTPSPSPSTLLWSNINGTASVWNMDSNGNLISWAQAPYGTNPGWMARSYHRNSDGTANLLWVRTDGFASVWTLNSSGSYSGYHAYGPFSGWVDWSWGGITTNYANTSPVHSGSSASIAITYTGGWAGLQIGYSANYLDVSSYDTFSFWVNGGTSGGQPVNVTVTLSNDSVTQSFIPQANTWTQVNVSLWGYASRSVYSIAWFNNSADAQSTFYLDDAAFVNTGGPAAPAASGPLLQVDVASQRHPISPYIYGINFASEAVADVLQLPVCRWGGNATSLYNWQLDVSNHGSDWYFENIPNPPNSNTSEILPDGSTADLFVEQNISTGTRSLLTVPIMDLTPKRREDNPYDCGFKVSKYGPQDSVDPYDTDCGNGQHNGVNITPNDTGDTPAGATDTCIPVNSSFVTSWVNHLTGKYGTAANGGVLFYDLDNEPMLWNSTHRDVHPAPSSYDEILSLGQTHAAAVKAADPGAQILGPVVWGWCAYFYSAVDGCSPGSDYQAHGNTGFVEWYLQQMNDYETQHGVRILDYVDVHYYPQENGVSLSGAGDADVQALRLRSTRSLWDPSYTDESWINEPVYLIPRMNQWVTANYPGTKLAVSEYNFGAPYHINGALAQADVLGIFGLKGLGFATIWGQPDDPVSPMIFAFRMYRNYDGNGSTFGDTSVYADSANKSMVSVYAAQHGANGSLTIMMINKTGKVLTCPVMLTGFAPAAAANVFCYSAANLGAIIQQPAQTISSPRGFSAGLPANSITLFVMEPKS